MESPAQRREALAHLQMKGLSGRAACRWAGLSRRVLPYQPKKPAQDAAAVEQMRTIARHHPRLGYRREGVLAGLPASRAWRLWKRHGFRLEKPRTRPKRQGSDPRPNVAERPKHVWTYDLLHDQLANGERFKTLSVLDEYTRECLVIHVAVSIRAAEVIAVLKAVIAERGAPTLIRSDHGSEFTAAAVQNWLAAAQVGSTLIDPGHPWHLRWLHRKLSRSLSRRVPEPGVVSVWRRSRLRYRTMAPPLQYRTSAQQLGLPHACPVRCCGS